MSKHPALVGVVPRRNLWPKIEKEKWYHIPIGSAPKNTTFAEYLAFYFLKAFGERNRYKVIYYAPVLDIETKKRIELFPEEPEHERANQDYFQLHLGPIRKLPRPIPSKRRRRIVHIPTSLEKLLVAQEINDLYDTSPLCGLTGVDLPAFLTS